MEVAVARRPILAPFRSLAAAVVMALLAARCHPVDAQSGTMTGTSKTLTVGGRFAPLELDTVAGVTVADGKLIVRGSTGSVTLDPPAGANLSKAVRGRWALTTEFDAGTARSLTFTHAESLEEFTIEVPPSEGEVRYGVFEGPSGADVMVLAWGAEKRSYWAHVVIARPSGGK